MNRKFVGNFLDHLEEQKSTLKCTVGAYVYKGFIKKRWICMCVKLDVLLPDIITY